MGVCEFERFDSWLDLERAREAPLPTGRRGTPQNERVYSSRSLPTRNRTHAQTSVTVVARRSVGSVRKESRDRRQSAPNRRPRPSVMYRTTAGAIDPTVMRMPSTLESSLARGTDHAFPAIELGEHPGTWTADPQEPIEDPDE
jgi:hypothetical protein